MNQEAILSLRDIHTLPVPDFWPPAPGWWVVAAMGLLGLGFLSRLFMRRFYRWRRRSITLKILNRLRITVEQQNNTSQFAAELSILLRRIALHRFPRDTVAGLSGENWLRFLDKTGGAGHFTHGPGHVLASAPYMRHAEIDVEGLFHAAQRWIKHNT